LWAENRAVQTSIFGTPTLVGNAQQFYRAGTAGNQSKGTDTHLQHWDMEGNLVWSLSLNTQNTKHYLPVAITELNNNIYVAGAIIDSLNQTVDYFLAKVDPSGSQEWFTPYSNSYDEIPAAIGVDNTNNRILITGIRKTSTDTDMLITALEEDGQTAWTSTYDHSGNIDAGLRIFEQNGQIIVNGTSQTSPADWDIVSWLYSTNGTYLGETRSTGAATNADELKDGVLQNGFINLVGRTILGGMQTEAKLIVLDAGNNVLWQDSYNQAGLNDEYLSVTADLMGTLTTVGYTTPLPNNQDLLLRKYHQNGTLIWHTSHDAFGENDQAIKVLQDNEGNALVLANVTQAGQKDVYMYCFEGSSGNLLWQEPIGNSPTENETGLNLVANILGDVYVTYAVNGITRTKAYNYEEVNYPLDNEPFSKGSLILEAAGRIYHPNGALANDIKYATFGLPHEYFFADDFFSTRFWDYTNDNVANDFMQRIDFGFLGSQPTSLGHITEYSRPEHFNYYLDAQAFEQQQAQNVLAYPEIYEGIDAYITTNSEGFKLVLLLKDPSANLADIALQIDGATGTFVHSGDVHIPTLKGDIVWKNPFSYTLGGDTIDDNLTEYDVDANGHLRFNHQGDVQYPYVIQIKAGVGATYAASAINNMDWSTFFGGDGDDGSFDMTVDEANGDLFVAGFTQSWNFPLEANVSATSLNGQYQGLVAKFSQNAELKWVSIIGSATTNGYNSYRVKGVGLHENIFNIPNNTKEVHFTGEYRGNLAPSNPGSGVSGAYQQTNTAIQTSTELFFGTLANSSGAKLLLTPFGGEGHETVNALDITPGGIMYFVGSTTAANNGSNVASSSQNPPANHTLPVYNPNDGSFFTLTHPSVGNKRGYVAAIELSTYKVVYASLITKENEPGTTDFVELYDIKFANDAASYCGRGTAGAKLGIFFPGVKRFATSLTQNFSDWPALQFFSSISYAGEYGWVYFGLSPQSIEPIFSLGLNNPFQQYQSTIGQAFLLRIDEAFENWKTYFGLNSFQSDIWNGYTVATTINFWSTSSIITGEGLLPGRGKLDFNASIKTLFAAASASGSDAPTQFRSGYFFENQNASPTSPDIKEDLYLSAFSYKNHHVNPLYDHFNWGTMYGSEVNTGSFISHRGREFLGDVHSYTLNNQSYTLTTGICTYGEGTTVSNINKYPVSNLGFPGSWYKDAIYPNSDVSDIVITRFGVSDIQVGLNTAEQILTSNKLLVYPNPSSDLFTVQLPNEAIQQIDIFDVNGRLVYSQSFRDGLSEIILNLSNLASGIYFINANNIYHAKVSKL